MNDDDLHSDEDRLISSDSGDGRRALIYLVVQESDQYIAIMEVLESSVNDLTPREVAIRLQAAGNPLDERVVEARLDRLRRWNAVSARTDTSRILRHSDLLARNWRYTATPVGRHVHRFYRKVLAGAPAVREIPLASLARVVKAVEALATGETQGDALAELIGGLFVSHDDLDAALVGAEDELAGLVDRFDLNDQSTAELKTLLVGYATRVAAELERGSGRAHRALNALRPRFGELATLAVSASDARVLIERGALAASRGGRVEDWDGLLAWLDPSAGRSTRFAMRLVRALPGMHVNLRRLHSSSGTATSRSRALSLARACADPVLGTAVFLAAVGDHPWRKLYGEAADDDSGHIRPWRDGPRVGVPELLRATGRAGPRGRPPAARDDSDARQTVAAARERRAAEHSAAIREVLAAAPGSRLSERAARIALVSLIASAQAQASHGRRSATRAGLACTLFHTGVGTGMLTAPTWRVLTPGRHPVFHLPGAVPSAPGAILPDSDDAQHVLTAVAAK